MGGEADEKGVGGRRSRGVNVDVARSSGGRAHGCEKEG